MEKGKETLPSGCLMSSPSRLQSKRVGMVTLAAVALLTLLALKWKEVTSVANTAATANSVPQADDDAYGFGSLGVPWCRSRTDATVNWTRAELLRELPKFVEIYGARPITKNANGMGFDHSFGLWFIARKVRPALAVESGVFKGHSTWVLRQALPRGVPIVAISPRHPGHYAQKGRAAYVDANCRYFTGEGFADFGHIDWDAVLAAHGITDRSRVLLFFDDHQNELKRIEESLKAGFQHLVFEDNYDTGTGDHYSMRQICDQYHVHGGGHDCSVDGTEASMRNGPRQGTQPGWAKAVNLSELCGPDDAWWGVRGEVRDDFGRKSVRVSHVQHAENGRRVAAVLDAYWEVPPTAGPGLTGQTRYDPARTAPPLVGDADEPLFRALFGVDPAAAAVPRAAFNGYTQMAYVKLRARDPEADGAPPEDGEVLGSNPGPDSGPGATGSGGSTSRRTR